MKSIIPLILLTLFTTTIFSQENPSREIVIDQSGTVHPWNHLEFLNDPQHFQFAIVTDRTGGHRPGVFEDAVRKLNLLQPEFVVSVGDMIEGYTRDEAVIYSEWEEFNGFIKQLEMPYFYVPGNHDYINDVMAKIWKDLYGPSYYHFTYKDVLFLCLNSEEAMRGSNMGGIEKPQYDYVEKVLEEHPDVRWTLVFMHQPLWLFDNSGYWKDIEKLLEERQHTVFVGHYHHYVKYQRNNGKYLILATTGGVSPLRGTNFGEFDHVVWVTMTEEGPVMANLLLGGIWDEDVVTEELVNLINARRVMVEPVFIDEDYLSGTEFTIKFTNDDNYPMWVYFEFEQNRNLKPEILSYQKEVGPNSVELVNARINLVGSNKLENVQPLYMKSWYVYKYEDNREIQLDDLTGLMPVKKEYTQFAIGKIWADGNLDEWEGFGYKVDAGSEKTGDIRGYYGDYDASFEFDIRYDNEFVYIGMSVWDDEVITNPNKSLWSQDAIRIVLDGRPARISANGTGENQFEDFVYLFFAPGIGKNGKPTIYQQERLPEGTQIATSRTKAGFDVEVAVPVSYFNRMNQDQWQNFRFNACFADFDKNASKTSLWWKPEWSSEKNYVGSGMFFKN
jgi:hypothetical protein